MRDAAFTIISEIQGIPFISEHFQKQPLLRIVTHYRHIRFSKKWHLTDYLNPEAIFMDFRRANLGTGVSYPHYGYLDAQQTTMLGRVSDAVLTTMPEWKALFQLGVSVLRIEDDERLTSMTNPLIPQVILLGAPAFRTQVGLEEILIHEMAHVWLGLICELDDVQVMPCDSRYALSCCTQSKDARGVLFAAHSAASVLLYLRKKNQPEKRKRLRAVALRYPHG